MRADRRQGPQTRRFLPRKGVSLALAIAVHLVFIAVLIFSIRWQNTPPTPVTAELYAAPSPVVAYNRYTHDVDRLATRYETFIEEFSNILQRQG